MARFRREARRAQAAIRRVAASGRTLVERLVEAAPYQAAAFNVSTRIDTLETQLSDDRLALAATRQLESAAFVSTAEGNRVSPATRRSLLLLAALTGLLVGMLLALGWEALRDARRAAGRGVTP